MIRVYGSDTNPDPDYRNIVMQDLPESEHQTLGTRLSFLQPYITQANLKPTDRDPEQVIAEIEKACENCLEKTRILISRPNQFSGYRSVVLFGSLFTNKRVFQDTNTTTFATVSSDGRLNGNMFIPGINGITSFPYLEDAMKYMETNVNEWRKTERSNTDIILFGSGSGIAPIFSEIEVLSSGCHVLQ